MYVTLLLRQRPKHNRLVFTFQQLVILSLLSLKGLFTVLPTFLHCVRCTHSISHTSSIDESLNINVTFSNDDWEITDHFIQVHKLNKCLLINHISWTLWTLQTDNIPGLLCSFFLLTGLMSDEAGNLINMQIANYRAMSVWQLLQRHTQHPHKVHEFKNDKILNKYKSLSISFIFRLLLTLDEKELRNFHSNYLSEHHFPEIKTWREKWNICQTSPTERSHTAKASSCYTVFTVWRHYFHILKKDHISNNEMKTTGKGVALHEVFSVCFIKFTSYKVHIESSLPVLILIEPQASLLLFPCWCERWVWTYSCFLQNIFLFSILYFLLTVGYFNYSLIKTFSLLRVLWLKFFLTI